MKLIIRLLVVMALLPIHLVVNASATDQILFSHAWVKMPMPGMQMSAGYVDIENTSSNDIKVIAVRTPFSKMAELHDMVMVNKVMQMRHASDGWVIAAGTSLSLAPGGKHAMLMGVKPLESNQSETILEFNIEGLGWVAVPAALKVSMP